MHSLIKNFGTDTNRENDGVWEDFGEGIKFKIRRLNSDPSLEARKKAEKPYLAQIRKGKLSDDAAEEIAIQQLALGVIADWEGVTDEKGTAIKPTDANKLAVLRDERLKDLRMTILQISMDADAYKIELDEDAEKN